MPMDMAAIAQAGQAMPMSEDIKPVLDYLQRQRQAGTAGTITLDLLPHVEKVEHFLSLIHQMQKQLHLTDEVKEPQKLSLRCTSCHGDFAVDAGEFAQFHEAGGTGIPCPNQDCEGFLELPT